MGERVVVTSGLSKAFGIPGVRIGWMVGPEGLIHDCWTQHDYLTIGPNKMSDAIARVAVEPANRERCYSRTRDILRHNLPIAREWLETFGGRLTWREPQAGAIGLLKYDAAVSSLEIAERIRKTQSTLIVPGSHVGLEGYIRVWLGGNEPFLREGLRRIGVELTRTLEAAQDSGAAAVPQGARST
jgi:aspartate/methionine/tyrosine aminotransferase